MIDSRVFVVALSFLIILLAGLPVQASGKIEYKQDSNQINNNTEVSVNQENVLYILKFVEFNNQSEQNIDISVNINKKISDKGWVIISDPELMELMGVNHIINVNNSEVHRFLLSRYLPGYP